MMACHDGVNTLTYDAEGRLATSYSPIFGVTSSYFYDAGGQRVSKIFGSYETDYVHGPGGVLLATYVNGSYFGNFQDLWVDGRHFGEVVMAAGNASQTQNFSLTDWLGSQAAYTGPATGVPNAAHLSQPFGDVQTTLFGSSNDDIHFTGKERDGDTGNDYFGARYYSSAMGRFLSADWISSSEPVPYANLDDPQSLNLYSYVRNNPLSRTDPDGHWCLFDEALSIPSSCTSADSQQQLQEAKDPAAKNAKDAAQRQNSNGPGFRGRLGQRISNFFGGSGFVTNDELDRLVGTGLVSVVPGSQVQVGAEALSVIGTVTHSALPNYGGAALSLANNHGLQNTVMTLGALVPVGVGDAGGALGVTYDAGKIGGCFITNSVMAPMIEAIPAEEGDPVSVQGIQVPVEADCEAVGVCD